MFNPEIKFLVLKKFPIQADFASVIKASESKVSRVIRGRVRIPQDEAKLWAKKLDCNLETLAPIVREEGIDGPENN